MRVIVDFDLCASTGGCVHHAPQLFKIGEDGYLQILIESPQEDLRAMAKTAEEMCPTGAISILD